MNFKEKLNKCNEFFDKLSKLLESDYEVLASCNKDCSRYLIPIGTSDRLSYYGKPDWSFRVSTHWNWYANINKCSNADYVQCLSKGCPKPRQRIDEKATEPRIVIQVCIFDPTCQMYIPVYGEAYSRNSKKWRWIESDPKECVKVYLKKED